MILFKPIRASDVPIVHGWLQLPHIREFWDDGHRKQKQVKQHYLKNDTVMRFIIQIDGQQIGYIQRYTINSKHPFWKYITSSPCVGVDMFIGDPNFLEQGWSTPILTQFINQYCPSATEIIVDPETDNYKAIHCYKKLGFQVRTTIRLLKKEYQLMGLERQTNLPNRIMLLGRPGSGKASFAKTLKTRLGISLYYFDKFFSLASWTERDYQEFLALQEELLTEEQNAICLYFNFPRHRCYWQVLKNLFNKQMIIDDPVLGRQKKASWSLLKSMWSYEKRVHSLLDTLRTKYPHANFIELTSEKELERFGKDILMLD
ncbi:MULTISPECIES: GNAT family N-acetyltransferase [unclassified Legionella]|uniref:GNAT family N-acetyltransferase n=1 Tax=unclassified Legionella TaxID=2622702 RepID=UPI001E308A13|nr:GNAT family N-acetyltransferase [Legionella sp. 31fI33]MCC5015222.1 GNAT family N-acetyltransferase [Legionella sp. 31fI33]